MAGLLDRMFATPSDQALFALGSGLLGVRRGNEGRAMMGALGAYNDAQQQERRNRLTDAQMAEMDAQGQFRAAQVAEWQRKNQEAAAQRQRLDRIRSGLPPEIQGAFEVDPQAWARAQFSPTKEGAVSPLARLLEEQGKHPPGSPAWNMYQDAIKKATTHQPPVNVTYGAPFPGVNPATNQPELFRPDNKGGMTPTGVRPITPPSERAADARERRDAEAAAKRAAGARTQADIVIKTVDEALGKVGYLTAGAGGAVMGAFPGTSARDLKGLVDTVKANIGFAQLQAMREASPTGGALGQVAVQELNFLQAAVASLDTAQSPDQLRAALGKVKRHFENWKSTLGEQEGGGGAEWGQQPQDEIQSLRSKYGLK